jgi:hypothetical protein
MDNDKLSEKFRATHFYHRVPINREVSLFGHRRIKASWQLPDDYRDHVRPSSENTTKVFTVCVCENYVLYQDGTRRPFSSVVKEQIFVQHKNL